MSVVICSRCDMCYDTDWYAEDILLWEPEVVCVGCATRVELAEFDEYAEAGCEDGVLPDNC